MPNLRKRKAQKCEAEHGDFFSDLSVRTKVLIFSGAGLSTSSGANQTPKDSFKPYGVNVYVSGMSTFGKSGGIYERAKKRFNLSDGKSFFQYSFFDQNRLDVLPFYAELYKQAVRACPAAGHLAINQIARSGRLLRHYTMNIDGLAARAGMEIWNGEPEKQGSTVELHGNIFNLVCHSCGHVEPLDQAYLKSMRARRPMPCPTCSEASSSTANMRPKVLLYDDAEGEHITPNTVLAMMEADAKVPFSLPSSLRARADSAHVHPPCAGGGPRSVGRRVLRAVRVRRILCKGLSPPPPPHACCRRARRAALRARIARGGADAALSDDAPPLRRTTGRNAVCGVVALGRWRGGGVGRGGRWW
jgi:NAD-dependent SIR2 family protein deacetylase